VGQGEIFFLKRPSGSQGRKDRDKKLKVENANLCPGDHDVKEFSEKKQCMGREKKLLTKQRSLSTVA